MFGFVSFTHHLLVDSAHVVDRGIIRGKLFDLTRMLFYHGFQLLYLCLEVNVVVIGVGLRNHLDSVIIRLKRNLIFLFYCNNRLFNWNVKCHLSIHVA
jgi:hypothetical protein